MAELGTNTEAEVTETTETNPAEETQEQAEQQSAAESAAIAQMKAEMAKMKAAMDKATKEAGDAKKALRAKQTAEEAAAETEKEQREAIEKELAELRKERAVANSSKRVMTFIQDEKTATGIAEALYGAADTDMAIDMLNKAWVAKEKALRMEFGKVPPPGVGSAEGPTITREQLDGFGYKDRLEFATKHPDEYRKLMGR